MGYLDKLTAWLGERGEAFGLPLPSETVLRWLNHLADQGAAASTLRVAAAAISAIHTTNGYHSPTRDPVVVRFVAGTSREIHRSRPVKQADPLLPEQIREVLQSLGTPGTYYSTRPTMLLRDKAIMLFGFASGCRRSELVALELRDLDFDRDGSVRITVRTMKHRYSGEAHERRVHPSSDPECCPVRALREWLSASGILEGLVFRRFYPRTMDITEAGISGAVVDRAVKLMARHVPKPAWGRQPHYSAHSLRAGVATAAALAEKPDREIQEHLGHKSVATTARYIRIGNVRKSTLTSGLL
jgi:integrase